MPNPNPMTTPDRKIEQEDRDRIAKNAEHLPTVTLQAGYKVGAEDECLRSYELREMLKKSSERWDQTNNDLIKELGKLTARIEAKEAEIVRLRQENESIAEFIKERFSQIETILSGAGSAEYYPFDGFDREGVMAMKRAYQDMFRVQFIDPKKPVSPDLEKYHDLEKHSWDADESQVHPFP